MALLSPIGPVRAWILAARPATLWAAVTPVLVGSALAHADGEFRGDAFVVTLMAALAIQIGVNFANDVADAGRGADTSERLGPPRMVASGVLSPATMWRGIAVVFGVAVACGLYLTAIAGWPIVVIGLASLVAALGYTGGPFPYGYRAMGEVFVFVFFGLVATVGSRYVHDRTAPLEAWLLAIPIGLLVTAILVVNNLRDIPTDGKAGKRTLAVVMGATATRHLFTGLVIGAFALTGLWAILGATPVWTALGIAAAPLAIRPVADARRKEGRDLIPALVGTGRLHFAFGVLVAVGALL